MIDPIVQEVRDVRQEHTNKFNGDLDAICADLRLIQKSSGHKVVTIPFKRSIGVTEVNGPSLHATKIKCPMT